MAQDHIHSDVPQRRLFSIPLVRELTVVLIIKLTILYIIWFAFFREPVTPNITSDTVAETIFGEAPPSPQIHNKSK